MDDGGIVELILGKDETAIALVREKYGARLRAIARGVLGDDGAAEECENDAYLEAWRRIPPHEPREYLFAFLARIVRAKALNRLKELSAAKRSAETVALTDELAAMLRSRSDTESSFEERELSASVSRYLRGVSDEKRCVFVRRYWYMEPIAQIARRYDMSESKVKSLLLRARRELRKHLEKEGFLQ